MLKKLKLWWKNKHVRLSPFVFKEAYYKKQGLEAKASDIKILGLGSSFCARSFNTDLIPNAFNLGTTDQDLYTTHFLFQKYLPSLKNLKKVIFFYGIFSPGHELAKTHSEKTVAIHHYVFDVPYPVNYLEKYKKAYLHRLKKILKFSQIPNKNGYIVPPKEINQNPQDLTYRIQSHLKNNNRGTNQTRYLEQIYQLCKQHHIKFYVAISPVNQSYIDALGDETDEHLFRELYTFTQKEHIPVLNEMRNKSFPDEEFFDCDHLNRNGAIHFTKLLLDFIKD